MTWPDLFLGQSEYQGVGAVPMSGNTNLDPPEGAMGKVGGSGC